MADARRQPSNLVRLGDWQRASTREGADLGRDVAPVVNGVEVIGYVWRLDDVDYRAVLASQGPGGYHMAVNPIAPQPQRDGIYRPEEHTEAQRFDSEYAAMLAVAAFDEGKRA